jgi:hypothetical protein
LSIEPLRRGIPPIKAARFRAAFWSGHCAIQTSRDDGFAKFRSRSHDAVIRLYDEAGNVMETHEHKGDFKD